MIEYRPDDIHLRELVVAPEHQGRGVGSAVIRRLQSEADAAGVPIRLGVFRMNRAAELYRRLGFRQFDETESHLLLEWVPQAAR